MAKAVSPAVGFNDNVRRRNRNFHVQTEDSGIAHPHIITHLFTDGGRIVKSVKQSYADIVAEEELGKRVRERMKAQHVGMLEALKSGEYDALVWGSRQPGKLKPAAPAPAPATSEQPAVMSSLPEPSVEPSIPQAASTPDIDSSEQAVAPARLPAPPRRSSPPAAAKKAGKSLHPPPRKTMPHMDAVQIPAPHSGVPAAAPRTRKSTPPRRSTRPPPQRQSARAAVSNPRDGLVSQTLDEVILRMLSEENDSKSGS